MSALNPTVDWTLAVILAVLTLASLAVKVWADRHGLAADAELRRRTCAWWAIVGLFGAALVLGRGATLVLLALVSFLALKEFFTLAPTRQADRRALFWAYLAIPLQYYWVAAGWYGMFIVFIPVYLFLFIPLRMVLIGETRDFLRSAGTLHWGVMVTVFGLSHAAYLLALPGNVAPAGDIGLLLYLVVLTELNDVAQYLWGKGIGGRRVVPLVSPGKTWGGLLGGVATTMALAWAAGPYLTPLTGYQALAAGALIGVFGFAGDITVSAVKRDLGLKDTGTLLPGHGGILDRVDSLTFTAPLFFHFLRYLHY